MNTSVSRLSRVVDMLDEAYAGPCSIARDPRPSRKVVSTLQVSRFMARQVHDGIPGNAAVGSTPERATPGVYRSGGPRSSRAPTPEAPSWQHVPALILCPGCGAARLIPLSFPQYRRESGAEITFRRPVAKCTGCGERVCARVVARARLPIDIEND